MVNKKKRRTHVVKELQEYDEVPKSMIIKRTDLPKDMNLLKRDLREMMYPFTAMNFKESTKLKIKEILAATKNFGVKNLMFLSSNPKGNYLKLLKVPNGPSFHLKI